MAVVAAGRIVQVSTIQSTITGDLEIAGSLDQHRSEALAKSFTPRALPIPLTVGQSVRQTAPPTATPAGSEVVQAPQYRCTLMVNLPQTFLGTHGLGDWKLVPTGTSAATPGSSFCYWQRFASGTVSLAITPKDSPGVSASSVAMLKVCDKKMQPHPIPNLPDATLCVGGVDFNIVGYSKSAKNVVALSGSGSPGITDEAGIKGLMSIYQDAYDRS
jgi:hypothetical protein